MRAVIITWIFLILITVAYSQETETTVTLEERVQRLERTLVALETRIDARTTVGAGALGSSETGLAAQASIDRVARDLTSLRNEVQRLRNQVESAQREATEARREAREAQMNARNALSRVR